MTELPPYIQVMVDEYRSQMELATVALLAGEKDVGLNHMRKCVEIFTKLNLYYGLTIDFKEDNK